jgi:hypothetical protein
MNVALFSIAGFFKLLNVGVLLGAGWYLFTTRLRPMLIASLTRKHDQQQSLYTDMKQTELALAQEQAELAEQRLFCQVAAQRLARWRAYEQEQAQLQQDEMTRRSKELLHRQTQQAQALQAMRLRTLVASAVMNQAEQELQKKFSLVQAGRVYIERLL